MFFAREWHVASCGWAALLLNDKEKETGPRDGSVKTLAESVLQTINTIVLVANDKGEILYASPSIQRILGYEPADVLGMKYWDTPSPDPEARQKHFDKIRSAARGERPISDTPYAVKMLTRSGEERWILWRDARASGNLIVGAGQDITELRRTQEELKRREEEIGAVFECANEGMLVVDENFRYVDANPAACEMFGLRKEEILGREVGSITKSKVGLETLRTQMQHGGEATEEIDYEAPNGTKRTLDCRLTANIRPGYHLVIIRDNTTRKALERQIAESQRLDAVGRLAGGVAHEFNNLLTAINGYAELIVKNSPPEGPIHKQAQSIVAAATRAAQTTLQLLAFSRRQVVQPKLLKINDAVRESSALLQQMLGEEIQLILRLNESCGLVRVDPSQVTQILINLGLNARESMSRGGKLIVETSPAKLDKAYSTAHVQVDAGSYVLLAVSDTGVGIEPELQSHVFEPFFTTKEEGQGAGLGLATVYGIVRQNGGHIWVYSEPGAGSTFKVYLPAVVDEAGGQSSDWQTAVSTILVVEDDLLTRRVIANSLREEGHRVLQAADGGEALALCEAFDGDLDLVITDLGAPAMSGEDLRAYFAMRYPKVKLLHMSGYSEEKLKATRELPREIEFLQKPFTVAELHRKVSIVLQRT